MFSVRSIPAGSPDGTAVCSLHPFRQPARRLRCRSGGRACLRFGHAARTRSRSDSHSGIQLRSRNHSHHRLCSHRLGSSRHSGNIPGCCRCTGSSPGSCGNCDRRHGRGKRRCYRKHRCSGKRCCPGRDRGPCGRDYAAPCAGYSCSSVAVIVVTILGDRRYGHHCRECELSASRYRLFFIHMSLTQSPRGSASPESGLLLVTKWLQSVR